MKSTKNKLRVFAIILVVLVALGLILQYIHFNGILKESKRKNILEYNVDLGNRLSSKLEDNKNSINILSKLIETVQWTEEDLKRYFLTIENDNDMIKSIYFADVSGELIDSDDLNPRGDLDFKERQWYKEVIKGEVMVSPVYEDAIDSMPVVTLSKAVYDENDKFLGVVAIDAKLESIVNIFDDLSNDLLDFSFLIDGKGSIITHKDHECEDCFNPENLGKISKEKYQEFKNKKSGMELIEIGGRDGNLFYDLIEGSNWIVASFICVENYLNHEVSILVMLFIILGFGLILSLLFTYLFKRYFINPTVRFYDEAKIISPIENKGYRMPQYEGDPFEDIRSLTNKILDKSEDLMMQARKNLEEIISQKEELEISYAKLAVMERELRHQNERNKAIKEALPDSLFIISRQGKFLDIQVSNDQELATLREKYTGRYLNNIVSVEIMKEIQIKIESALDDNRVEKYEYTFNGQNGIQRYEFRIAKMNKDNVLAIARNITKRKELEDELIDLSYKDQLTNFYNRRYFEETLKKIDDPKNFPISIIMADINGLKLINDSFGHSSGEQLIKGIGKIIKKGCRSEDMLFRIGGDEFVIILANTQGKAAGKVVDRIKEISKSTKLESQELKDLELAVSFGIATKDGRDTDIYDLAHKAEENMYYHKLHEGQEMRLRTIKSMIESLFKKDPRIKESTKKTMEYAGKLAQVLNLSDKLVDTVKDTAYYQEIGKITISDELLHKTKNLTEKEIEEINRHPEVGYRILSTVNEMLEVAQYVLYHHERYDGSGYPKGLKGEKIPLVSRIISLVESYLFIKMDKDYENIVYQDFTIEKLRQDAGSKLDPKLVDVFIKEVLKYE